MKWHSAAAAVCTVLALLVPLSGCGSDAGQDAASAPRTKAEDPEQIFKDIIQKNPDKRIPLEDFIALDAPSAATFMTTPDCDGKTVLRNLRSTIPDDLKWENIQISNIRTRDALMRADVTGTAVLSQQGQKNTVHSSASVVLRRENGTWKQLPMGIVEAAPLKSIEVISGGMRNVSIHGNIGRTFDGEQVVFLSFKNNSTTNYSMGWVQAPGISAVTEGGEVLARAIPKYDIAPPSQVIRIANETFWLMLPFPEAEGTIREIRFTDFHVLNAHGLPTDSFETPTLVLRLTM